jgi:hypothetical protein
VKLADPPLGRLGLLPDHQGSSASAHATSGTGTLARVGRITSPSWPRLARMHNTRGVPPPRSLRWSRTLIRTSAASATRSHSGQPVRSVGEFCVSSRHQRHRHIDPGRSDHQDISVPLGSHAQHTRGSAAQVAAVELISDPHLGRQRNPISQWRPPLRPALSR